jgi:hypothetical protein
MLNPCDIGRVMQGHAPTEWCDWDNIYSMTDESSHNALREN